MRSISSLLKLEFSKFLFNPVYRVILGLFILLMPSVIFLGKDVFNDPPPPIPSSKVFYEFPTVWDYQGYVGNWLVSFLLGFVAIYIVTSEVSNRTMRQNIIGGLERRAFFFSKIWHIAVLAIGATVLYTISVVIIGWLHTDAPDFELIMDNNWAILRFFAMSFAYMAFGIFIAFFIRRGTLALFTYFMYVNIIETILMAVHMYYFKHESRNFWPMNSIEDLMPLPLYRMSDYFVKKQFDFNIVLSYPVAFGMTTLYTTIFLFLAYRNFLRRDI